LAQNDFDELAEKSLQGVMIYQDGKPAYANEAMAEIHGYSTGELLAMSVDQLGELVHPEDRAVTAERRRKRVEGEPVEPHVEIRIVRKDGSVRWIRSFNNTMRYQGRPAVLATAVDVTDYKRALEALRESEKLLRQSQKMEAMGRLAGGVAHDFNNLLAIITMQAALVDSLAQHPPAVREALQEVMAAAERAAHLTRQLLLFSRKEATQKRHVDLDDVVANLTRMLQRVIGEDVRVELRASGARLVTHADVGMLDQVLLNLGLNARDAMPGGGRLLIETGDSVFDAGALPPRQAGRHVWVAVTDDGTGIDPDVLPHIFEPFFTTKEPGRGTGLGLATVFGIVEQHGGWVEVWSEPARGARFQVFLPAHDAAVTAATTRASARADAPGGTEVILLVEDEVAVRAVVRTALRRSGYRVLEAAHAAQCLEVWAAERGSIALVLTDLVMPGGMNGLELARELKRENAGLKVLFMSGYSADVVAGESEVLRAGVNFLQKPFSPQLLLALVRRALDGGGAPVE
jgi:PAS domain S-box-containing protein